MKCLVCGEYHHQAGSNWLGWWGENQRIRNDEGVFVERGIYCEPCTPQWVREKMEE